MGSGEVSSASVTSPHCCTQHLVTSPHCCTQHVTSPHCCTQHLLLWRFGLLVLSSGLRFSGALVRERDVSTLLGFLSESFPRRNSPASSASCRSSDKKPTRSQGRLRQEAATRSRQEAKEGSSNHNPPTQPWLPAPEQPCFHASSVRGLLPAFGGCGFWFRVWGLRISFVRLGVWVRGFGFEGWDSGLGVRG